MRRDDEDKPRFRRLLILRGGSAASVVSVPTNSVAPVISGNTQVGQTLSTTDGTWSGSPSFTYQWKRAGSSIGSATNNTYVLTVLDIAQAITCAVTGTNAGGNTTATSNTLTGAASSVIFDGTNDYLTRTPNFTGAADSKVGIISFWFWIQGGDGATQNFLRNDQSGSGKFIVQRTTSNTIQVLGRNSGSVDILSMLTTATYASSMTGWAHFLAAWNLATGAGNIYVNNVADLAGGPTLTNDTIFYNGANNVTGATVGASESGTNKLNSYLAEFYFNEAEYIDITNASNRAKFISGGHPVSLGANGSTPTGTQPIAYYANPLASWHTNLGSGGGSTLNGALTAAPSNP